MYWNWTRLTLPILIGTKNSDSFTFSPVHQILYLWLHISFFLYSEESSLELTAQMNRQQQTDSQSFFLGSFDDIPQDGLSNSRIFLNICITDTETATENRGANQYTLYTIQVPLVEGDWICWNNVY